ARPGMVQFGSSASPDGATFIANAGVGAGGELRFFSLTTISSNSRMMLFGNGNLDLSGCSINSAGLTIRSLAGDGAVFLGSKNLSVGSNNLDTIHSGIIQDGGYVGGTGGSLTKVGAGTLTLRGKNRYTGLTTVSSGTLVIANRDGSATGTNEVKVNA